MPQDDDTEVRFVLSGPSPIGTFQLWADRPIVSRIALGQATQSDPEEKSIIRQNAEKDPNYKPYCGRCRGLVRMRKVRPFLWDCFCGAVHDEQDFRLQEGDLPPCLPKCLGAL